MIARSIVPARTVRKVLGYLPQFFRFAYHTFPGTRVVLGLTLLTVLLEYATLSLMLPLAGGSGASVSSQAIVSFWNHVAVWAGFPMSAQTWLWMFLVLLAMRTAVGYTQLTLNIWVAKQIHSYLSDQIFRRVVAEEPLTKIFQRTIGYYVSLAGDETYKAGSIFYYLGQVLAAAMSASVGLGLLYIFSERSFWLTILFIGVCGLLLLKGMRVIFRLSSDSLDLSRALNTNFIDALNGLRSIRSLSAEDFIVHTYRTQIRHYVRKLFRIEALNRGFKAIPALILLALGMAWLWPTAGNPGNTTAMFFFGITTMLIRILAALGELVTVGGKLISDIRASKGAGELLSRPRETAQAPSAIQVTNSISSVSVRNLACSYDGTKAVLKDISGEFRSGRSYGIVGKSGAGKSTLADALIGIIPLSSGQILINDIPITTIDTHSIRRRIILVEQQTRIFSGSLRDNVTMGLKSSDDGVVAALQSASLGDFLSELSHGLETRLDYQGSNLSGGQRQRIGIARALIRKPDVLILDEATNAVDPAMRKALVAGLRRYFRDKILVFLTHDSEVLTTVDEIWRIENGLLERHVASSQESALKQDLRH